MMCVVMFGHAMLPYVTIPRRFNDPAAHIAFDSAGVLLYAFAMPAFFVTAGFSAAALYRRRGALSFWRNRAFRIGLPLVVGYLVLTPLTRAAYQFAAAAAETGTLTAGWEAITTLDWMRYSKLYHLWFLASLILFSALNHAMIGALRRLPKQLTGQNENVSDLGIVVFIITINSVLMTFSYADGTGQGTDLPVQLSLLTYFVAGWWLASNTHFLARLQKLPPSTFSLFLVLVPLCVWSSRERLLAEDQTDWLFGALAGTSNAFIGVLATIGLLSFFERHFAKDSVIADYLGNASYWVYLVHYPVIVLAGGIVSVLYYPAAVKYALTLLIAVPIIVGSFEAVRRWQTHKLRNA